MVQVVTVVTRLFCNDFFFHHSISQVVTAVQVVTGSNAEGAIARIGPLTQDVERRCLASR